MKNHSQSFSFLFSFNFSFSFSHFSTPLFAIFTPSFPTLHPTLPPFSPPFPRNIPQNLPPFCLLTPSKPQKSHFSTSLSPVPLSKIVFKLLSTSLFTSHFFPPKLPPQRSQKYFFCPTQIFPETMARTDRVSPTNLIYTPFTTLSTHYEPFHSLISPFPPLPPLI